MLKQLTIASCIALLSACTITSDGSASDTNNTTATDTNDTSATTSGTTTEAPTTANPTTGTTTEGPTTANPTTGTTGEAPTTGVTTTEGTTVTTSGTTGDTSGGIDTEGTTGGDTETTGGGLYDACGWNVAGYYACADMGGVPNLEDPMMTDPIACADGLVEGAACDDKGMGGAGTVGCCTPEGGNYFCDGGKIFLDDCAG